MDDQPVPRREYNDENIETNTSIKQKKVEKSVAKLYSLQKKDEPTLNVKAHITYLTNALEHLPPCHMILDASRPWLCYWICHSLLLLDYEIPDIKKSRVVDFIKRCQHPEGGFGGGPGQYGNLATTYAAVATLCCIGTKEAFLLINRESLKDFLLSLKCQDGDFKIHLDGESDIRAVYCAAAVASLLNLNMDELFENTASWVASCQTYEGGFSGNPGSEAHGGFSYCGIATLTILNAVHLCNVNSLIRWSVNRQLRFEGGFQGRTNKLIDGCYSFWTGSVLPIVCAILNHSGTGDGTKVTKHLYNNRALQEYILYCCQDEHGGLIDKPGSCSDIYHTCYALSGLSISQTHPDNTTKDIVGNVDGNKLNTLQPVYNLESKTLQKAMAYFANKTVI